jgi:hypothetical protein
MLSLYTMAAVSSMTVNVQWQVIFLLLWKTQGFGPADLCHIKNIFHIEYSTFVAWYYSWAVLTHSHQIFRF